MFGELIGVWMASVWKQMGAPENVRIVELGPGRGTMMVDALRAAKVVRDFHAAIVLHLVEISPILQRQQQERMETLGLPVLWHATLDDVPGGPSIVVANEFFDALPVHQAVKRADGWHERVIETSPSGDLRLRSCERTAGAFRHHAAARIAPIARRLDLRMALGQGGARTWSPRAHGRRGAHRRLRPRLVRAGRDPAGRGRPQARQPVALARLHRSHGPRRFPRARGERRNDRRAHPRPGFPARLPPPPRYREARGGAQDARRTREGSRDRQRALAPHGDGNGWNGRIVQGARHFRRPASASFRASSRKP